MPRIQQKRGTSANLASVNPTPLAGELVWDSTENAVKIGDGSTAWTSLAYVTATPRTHTHSADAITSGTVAYARLPVGSTTSTVCAGDDARLSNARTPTAHKASHATGGSDALTPSDIGAAPAASPTFTGTATFELVSKLEIATAGGAAEWFDSSSRPIIFQTTGAGSDFNSEAGHLAIQPRSNAGRSIIFGTGSGTVAERMRITAAGNVLVGTTTQSGLLHVNGVITVTAGSAGAPSIISTTGTSDTGQWFPAADTIAWSTAGSERVRVKSGGAVRYVPLTADPASGEAGDVYYNSTLNKLRVYNGSRWVSLHGSAWDISTAVLAGSFSVASQEEDPTDIAFKPDGLRMYIAGFDNNIYEYDLAVAWDVTTATYSQSFSVSAQESGNRGVTFSADGSKMFTIGLNGDDVNEYALSTPWDVSTATYTTNFSVGDKEGTPTSVKFSVDGANMYVLGLTTDHVYQYTLATAFDVSTATYSQSFSVLSQESSPFSVWFRPDGLRMYVLGYTGDDVNEYVLSTAWDISTAAYAQVFSVAAQENDPRGLAFSVDGTRMYVVGRTNDKVHQYSLL